MRVRLKKCRLFDAAFNAWQEAGWVIQVSDEDGAAMIAAGEAEWVPNTVPCMKDQTGYSGCTPPPQLAGT